MPHKFQIFDDVAVELAMALLQFMSEKPVEALLWRGLKSLLRCCQLARSEVTTLILKYVLISINITNSSPLGT